MNKHIPRDLRQPTPKPKSDEFIKGYRKGLRNMKDDLTGRVEKIPGIGPKLSQDIYNLLFDIFQENYDKHEEEIL